MKHEMGMIWCDTSHGRVSVTAWVDDKTKTAFNLSDYEGDCSFNTKKFRALSEDDKQALLEGKKQAIAEAKMKLKARQASEKELAKVWRDDMIQYDDTPYALIDRTLAGTNMIRAKDAVEFPTYQSHQFCGGGSTHAYDRRLHCYYGCLIEGGIAIDRSEVLDERPGLSFSSPMLAAGITETKKFRVDPDNFMLNLFASSPDNGFCGLARLAKSTADTDFGGFDDVPMSVWLAWWKDKGAKIGTRIGNTIVWDNGEVHSITPVESRWTTEVEVMA